MNNYIPASPTSYIGQLKTADVTIEEIGNFFGNHTAGILHCVEGDIPASMSFDKFDQRVDKTIDKLQPLLQNIPLYLDSGGFQVLTGKYDIDTVQNLFVAYYAYLRSSGRYDKAFVLDLPPNDKCFNNWDEVEYWNNKTYKEAADMNSYKNIFVFHMLNYPSYKIFDRLFEKYHTQFGMFAVGGIAIKQYGNLNRMVSYSIPFKIYLEKCLRHNLDTLNLHLLGAGQWSSSLTMLFELVSYFIKEEYGITFNIQSDSCGHIGLSLGRQIALIDNDIVYREKYFSKELDFNFFGKSKEEYILDVINNFAEDNNFSGRADCIYREDRSTNPTFYILLTLYDILIYKQIQSMIRKEVPELIFLYKNDTESFYTKLLDLQKRLNGGRLTRNLKQDTQNIIKFFDILKDKDLNRVEILLKQNSSDIFQNGLLTI